MTVKSLIKPGEYHDSVSLMLVARTLSGLAGVQDAAVVMATEANKSILATAGMLDVSIQAATANDLVIVVNAQDESTATASLQKAEALLKKKPIAEEAGQIKPRTLRAALASHPEANVVVISVAGRYAADEAWEALRRGLHVLLFSDHVSLEDELALKKYAREQGLLLMGPGAGTAILNHVALGFANVIPAAPIGIVSAAGTGLQEVSSLLARHGAGISQGIGVGGRDLSQDVGGIMMLEGLKALQADPETKVIILVSKPPAEKVAGRILAQVSQSKKPSVVCFLGGDLKAAQKIPNALPACTLQEAVWLALKAGGFRAEDVNSLLKAEKEELTKKTGALKAGRAKSQRYLRGLFSGGTLCYEAQVIWKEMLREPVVSNAPLPGGAAMEDSMRSHGHCAVDMGEEEFTLGRPHPMIDNSLRIRRLLQEARDPEVAVILLDVVLGFGAHPDPAAELGPAIEQARDLARQAGRSLPVVASVTGTEDDPQCLSRTVARLERAGACVCDSNASAARLTGLLAANGRE